MTAPTNKHQGKQRAKFVKGLPPQDPIGAEFTSFFNHPWDFIEANVPLPGERAMWHTVNRYPLQPRNLWDKYLEPDLLLGLRFGSFTRYFVSDIDRKGCYHPLNNKEKFKEILGVLEEKLGVGSSVIVQSSESGGIHIYSFLPEAVHSYTLAVAVRTALNSKGLRLVPGRLEIFPNPKPWKPGKPSNYNAHRLPLQAGSFLVDEDLKPISKDIKVFLEQASLSAESQDRGKLRKALEEAKQHKDYYRGRSSNKAEEFRLDLQSRISQGWTGYSQTNDLLRDFAVYGIVFLGLSGESLVQYTKEMAEKSPGYTQYCRHQHEIEKRSRERAKDCEGYPYYPYPNSPVRDKTYIEHFYGNEVALIPREDPSRKRHREALDRVMAAIAMLKNQGLFPDTVTKRMEAIEKQLQEAFNGGVSPATLYKKEYKYLWHPSFEVVESEPPVKADSSVEENVIIGSLCEEVEKEAKIEASAGAGLQVICLTECLLCLPGAGEQEENCETERSSVSIAGQEGNSENPSLDKVSLILVYLVIDSNLLASLISEADSDSSIQELKNGSEQLKDKGFLYPISTRASVKKSTFDYQENLLLLRIILTGILEGSQCQRMKPSELEDNRGSCVSQQEAITTFSTQDNLTGSQEACNSQTERICDCSDSQAFASQPEPPTPAEDVNSADGEISPLQWEEVRFKLQARPEAKRKLQEFCAIFNLHLAPREREALEQFLKYCLMQRSPFEALRLEARDWFKASRELIAQIDGCTAFWDYFGELVF